MKTESWLIVNKNGIVGARKSKPNLEWNEIAIKVCVDIPNQLFERPTIQANLKVENIENQSFDADILVNTAELIKQQTGAKVIFEISKVDNETETGGAK